MNDDLISRQAAIDFIDAGHLVNPNEPRWSDNDVVNFLKSRPSAQPEQKWIPCSERLPETHKAGNSVSGIFMESKPVLVYGVPEYESEYSFNVVTYCDDLNGNTYWSTEMDAIGYGEETPVAWMPLPEPYEEGE